MPRRSEIENIASVLLNELFGVVDNTEVEVCEIEVNVPTAATFAQDLQKMVDMKTTPRMAEVLPTNKSLKSEMNHYDTTGQRGDTLQNYF